MMKILANDGISPSGKKALEEAGFRVVTENVPQDELAEAINKEQYVALLVRSATKVRKDLIDQCPSLKLIGRGGVGMDNIDVEYAREKGLSVINTPAASSLSVAELVMAHAFGAARFVYNANRTMPEKGATEFKALKKKYAKGSELRGKTMGVIGMGRIGQALATYALGCGMDVVYFDRSRESIALTLNIPHTNGVQVTLQRSDKSAVLKRSDFLSLHVPAQPNGDAVIGKAELAQMKPGSYLINTARGGSVDEKALVEALNSGHLAGAALDVFENEPAPSAEVLSQDKISLTPHIGAATAEAQDRIGLELAERIKTCLLVDA